MAIGYKIYYDINLGKFFYEGWPSEVEECTSCDQTTAWFNTFLRAEEVVTDYNHNHLDEVKTCKDCGQTFWLTKEDEEWYSKKNLQPPKRCASCRAKRRKKQ